MGQCSFGPTWRGNDRAKVGLSWLRPHVARDELARLVSFCDATISSRLFYSGDPSDLDQGGFIHEVMSVRQR